ncbi:MAG: error-prone DNA polymerase, partial [Anaerolineae bacterium]|nr:error-prone DNA polymerase [Anaerolineae bacterium]
IKRSGYIELHAHSNHSLLDGVPFPEDLVARAADYEMPALALTDHDGFYGAVRFIRAAEAAGIKPILGAEVTLTDESHLTLLAETAEGYANLSQLITLAHLNRPKGTAYLDPHLLVEHHTGLIALSGCRHGAVSHALLEGNPKLALETALNTARIFGAHRFYIELQRHYHPGDAHLVRDLHALATHLGLGVVATGNVHYLEPAQREIHDVLTCIRLNTALDQTGDRLRPNDEYRFHPPGVMAQCFADIPEAITNTVDIAARCASATTFLAGGHQILPIFETPNGESADAYLRRLCEQAMRVRYPTRLPSALLEKELGIIRQLDLANYFLIVADIVHFARSNGIRCQGRGSAANSLVAYLLNISPIDPVAIDLVFERFLSIERSRPPDIDIDFAADRREEVIQYVYNRYGRDHAAMACTLVTFRSKSSVRDTARALGFPPALIERLSDILHVHDDQSVREAEGIVRSFGADLSSAPFQHLLRLAPQLEHIPRHLGIHNGGMILSGPALSTLIPLEPATMADRTVVQWDKEALEEAGIVKVDLLGLRMLSAIEDAVTIAGELTGARPDLDALEPNDPEVYAMLQRGETIGVFQVESRAQASLIPNFKPTCFADLTIEISLIRPGPLQGNMVRPYLRRRQGLEPVRYLHPRLKPALEETLGVIVFQEQVLKVAQDLAGFTPGEGDQLRRALSSKKGEEAVAAFNERFLQGAHALDIPPSIAEKVFAQLTAFGGYSFPKSHAAAFAVLTYQSAWLRRYHPVAFFAALLRHQPMGFYPAHVIVSEAKRHGVEIRGVDLHTSDVGATVESSALPLLGAKCPSGQNAKRGAIRLGLETVRGLGEEASTTIVEARRQSPFQSLVDLCQRTGLGRRAIEALIMAGALDRLYPSGQRDRPRRQLLWELQAALESVGTPPALDLPPRDDPTFTAIPRHERLWLEQTYTGVTAGAHITDLVGSQLRQMGATPVGDLARWPDGTQIRVGGVIVARQRPPTANGVAFLAIEDRSGIVNVMLYPEIAQTYHRAVMARFVIVEGEIRRDGAAMSVLGKRVLTLAV